MKTRKAITIKEIKGPCIDTIPVGIKLEVFESNASHYYYNVSTNGFGVTSVWVDEIEFIQD